MIIRLNEEYVPIILFYIINKENVPTILFTLYKLSCLNLIYLLYLNLFSEMEQGLVGHA